MFLILFTVYKCLFRYMMFIYAHVFVQEGFGDLTKQEFPRTDNPP